MRWLLTHYVDGKEYRQYFYYKKDAKELFNIYSILGYNPEIEKQY